MPTSKFREASMSSLRYNPINLSSLFGTHQINQIVKGWINYFRIGKTKMFIDEFGRG